MTEKQPRSTRFDAVQYPKLLTASAFDKAWRTYVTPDGVKSITDREGRRYLPFPIGNESLDEDDLIDRIDPVAGRCFYVRSVPDKEGYIQCMLDPGSVVVLDSLNIRMEVLQVVCPRNNMHRRVVLIEGANYGM